MIVHICSRAEWEAVQPGGDYRTASLVEQGFIHASRPEQALATANRFFAGQDGLVLLWIDPQLLQAPLVFEPADGDTFPHIYGALNPQAVIGVSTFSPDSDGVFRSLPEFQD